MAASWLLFPTVLLALAAGCGLLVERVSGARLPGALVAPTGLAVLIVIAGFFTRSDATAELAVPACVIATVCGFAAGRHRIARVDRWPAAAAAAVFLAYGAPVLLSGEPTFTGYIRLDDTSTWLALVDRAMEHGRSLTGLAPSTYEATLSANLAQYPLGSLLPWAVGAELVGRDPAWVFQPYLAFAAAMLALVIFHLARGLVASRAAAAAVAFVAAQAALLYAYALWGGVKEIAAALLIPLVAALVPWTTERAGNALRRPLPVAVAAAATMLALSVGGIAWVTIALLGALPLLRARGWTMREALVPIGTFAGAGLIVALPALLTASAFVASLGPIAAGTAVNTGDELGNLIRPLPLRQVAGIWPAGDFRIAPGAETLTSVLIVIVAAAAAAGLGAAVRQRAWGLVLYAATTLCGSIGIAAYGSSWVDAKVLATTAPLIVLLAGVAAAYLWERRSRVGGAALGAVLAGGVLWSNALGYREVNLAPYGALRELEHIGAMVAGKGPALMTEYQPYGVRHFLRAADPEGASELRRRQVALRTGATLPKAGFADIDEFPPATLAPYRTLVLRRSPAGSRPPAAYRLTWRGGVYEVWERVTSAAPAEHLPLGNAVDPAGAARCADVLRLAGLAGPQGRLATVFRRGNSVTSLSTLRHPPDWDLAGQPYLTPRSKGTASGSIVVPGPGVWDVWAGGSTRSRLEVRIDGRVIGRQRHGLNHSGGWLSFGSADVGPGRREIELRYDGPGLRPGSAGDPYPLGPLALTPAGGPPPVAYLPAADARSLCGKTLDWIEALPPA